MPEEFKNKAEREKYIVGFVRDMWNKASEETIADRRRWDLGFGLFQGKQDWSDREDWQSKPFIHEYSRLVRRTADSLTGLIFQRDDFFTMSAVDKNDPGKVELIRIFYKIVTYHLTMMKLPSLFYDYALMGGVTGLGIFKVFVEAALTWTPEVIVREIETQERKARKQIQGKLRDPYVIPDDPLEFEALLEEELDRFLGPNSGARPVVREISPKKVLELRIKGEVVDPRDFVIEPNINNAYDSQYKIQRFYKRFYEVESLFESGVFDKSKRDKLVKVGNNPNLVSRSTTVNTYESIKILSRDQSSQANNYAPVHEYLEYFGPLLGKRGEVLEEDMHFIVVSGDILLKDQQNPYWSKESPYLFSVFTKVPLKAVGQGISDNGIDQQLLMNDLFGTFLDMFKLAIHPPTVVDAAALQPESAEELELGMFPGQILKSFGKPASEITSQIQLNAAIAPLVFQTIARLSQQAEASAGVDVSNPNQGSRSRITATEIERNVTVSDDSVLSLAREIDQNWLIPLIQKIVDYTLQFGLEREALSQLEGSGVLTKPEFDLISGIPKIERFNEIKQNYNISIKGFRQRFERQIFLRNVVDFISTSKNLPPAAVQSIDWNNALEDVVEAFGFDPNRWIYKNTPQDKAEEENSILKDQQFITVSEVDDDKAHLPVHYNGLLSAPNEAFLAHIKMHLSRIMSRGEPMPDIPPEIKQVLGIPEQQAIPQQETPRPNTPPPEMVQ